MDIFFGRPFNVTKSLTRITLAAIPSDNYGYDANDRLVSDSYDANGNTLFAPSFAQSLPDKFDFENRLLERSEAQKHIRIIYDGDGHRVRKIVTTPTNIVTTYFLVDTVNLTGYTQVMEELTTDTSNPLLSTPQVTRVYSYGLDLIGQEQFVGGAWQLSFYGYDGHGNVRFLTSGSGAVTDTYDYDAFGKLIAATGAAPNAHLYCGEQLDFDLGLYFLRARYMNPDTGRFWTMDEFQGITSQPVTLHKYLYVGGNPANDCDPSGAISLAEANAIFGKIGTLTRIASSTLRVFYAAQSLADVYNAIQGVTTLFSNGAFENYLQDGQQTLKGIDLKKAVASLERNYRDILQRAYPQWSRFLVQHGGKVQGFLIYLPNAGVLPQIPIATPIRIGNRKVTLLGGGRSIPGRVIGGSQIPGSPHDMASKSQQENAAKTLRKITYDALRAAGCRKRDATEVSLAAENYGKLMGWF